MEYIEINPENINVRRLGVATDALRNGGTVVYPTDTHPAAGCDALDPRAIKNLCRIMDVDPERKTLTILCGSLSQAATYARIDNRAFALMKQNGPGPYTYILPAAPSLPRPFKGRKEVGIRIPDSPIALALMNDLGHPLVSVSLGGKDPMNMAHAVSAIIADIHADPDQPRPTSTIISLIDSANPEILRQGLITNS